MTFLATPMTFLETSEKFPQAQGADGRSIRRMGRQDASESHEDTVSEDVPVRSVRRTRLWNVVGIVVLLTGLTISAIGAMEWHGYVQDQARDAFTADAFAVSAAVSTAIRRDIDFVATQRSGVIAVPNLSNREFAVWYKAVDIKSRFPGGVGFAFVQRVTPAHILALSAPPSSLIPR